MYEIISESIKSAISLKLGQIFNNPNRYKENITSPKYPNFFVNQLNINMKEINPNRMQLDYFMDVQYRVAENTEAITNLQQQLDNIGLTLLTNLKSIDLELPTKTKNLRYEKSDGILHCFFNITVFVTPYEDEKEKLRRYKLNEEVKL